MWSRRTLRPNLRMLLAFAAAHLALPTANAALASAPILAPPAAGSVAVTASCASAGECTEESSLLQAARRDPFDQRKIRPSKNKVGPLEPIAGCSKTMAKRVRSMSTKEQIGQMTQETFSSIMNGTQLDREKLISYLTKSYVGSFLGAPLEYSAGTAADWIKLTTEAQDIAVQYGSKVPLLFGIDSVHGANYVPDATIFPAGIGMAATFNRSLVTLMGEITAKDTRATGFQWTFAPMIDIVRNAAWPRQYEGFGDTPHLVSELGVAFVQGLQGRENNLSDPIHIAATAKHFVGYGVQVNGLDQSPSWIPERFLKQYQLPPFQAVIKAGVATVMEGYGAVNGDPLGSSHAILQDLLRDKLGFDGLLVTDYGVINKLATWWKTATDEKDAVLRSIGQTSIDISMVSPGFAENLNTLVEEGKISSGRIAESACRAMHLKERLGLLGGDPNRLPPNTIGDAFSRQAALDGARESIALLRNENNLLPLKAPRRVLVTGPSANDLRVQCGGWTISWQGGDNSSFTYGTTLLQGMESIQTAAGIDEIFYSRGCASISECSDADIASAAARASESDVVVVALGESTYAERPGTIYDQSLDAGQLRLLEALNATGTPVVLVLIQGRPRLLNGGKDMSAAVLDAFLPGPDGGRAIAEIIVGITVPSGRLPHSYPSKPLDMEMPQWRTYSEDITPADWIFNGGYTPEWEFGTGLSYTTFAYSEMAVEPQSRCLADMDVGMSQTAFQVKFVVRNLGSLLAKETVLIYIKDEVRSIVPEMQQLRWFDKFEIAASKQVQVTADITWADLSFVGLDGKWIVEKGDFKIIVNGFDGEDPTFTVS